MRIIRIAKKYMHPTQDFAKDIANLTDFTFGTVYRTFMYRKSPYFIPELFEILNDPTLDYEQKINKAVQTIEKRGYSKKGNKKSESSSEYVKEIAKRTGLNPKTLSVYIGHPRHKSLQEIFRMRLPWEQRIDKAVRYLDENDIGYLLKGGVTPMLPEYQDAGEKSKWDSVLRDVQDQEIS